MIALIPVFFLAMLVVRSHTMKCGTSVSSFKLYLRMHTIFVHVSDKR